MEGGGGSVSEGGGGICCAGLLSASKRAKKSFSGQKVAQSVIMLELKLCGLTGQFGIQPLNFRSSADPGICELE